MTLPCFHYRPHVLLLGALASATACFSPNQPITTGSATDADGDSTGDDTDPNTGRGPEPEPDDGQTTQDGTSSDGAPSAYECGNGIVEGDELCDGADLDGHLCQALGFGGGTLACATDCTFDVSQCDTCGNGALDGDEACDGTESESASACDDVGLGSGDEALHCTAWCTLDFGECSACGDGVVTAPELCEPGVLDGATCASEGFDGGTLGCTAGCTFDPSGCTQCGNGTREGEEACDGNQVDATCADLGFNGGSLQCAADCKYDTSMCGVCGDGTIAGPEACDGAALGGATCQSQGFFGGTLGCATDCTLDTSDCAATAALRVFVTSGHFAANFGGALQGDALCQDAADDAGLVGSFRAWLSDATTTPVARFTHSDGPYALLNGTTIANDWNDLVDGQIAAAIGITELGVNADVPSTTVVTASTGAGALQMFNGTCQNWTSNSSGFSAGVGNVQNTSTWAESGATGCTGLVSLYCFEQ